MSDHGSGLRRRVVDGVWLRALYRAGEVDRLGTEGWADVITHAGLRPLLALSDDEVSDPDLARALTRVRNAGQQLEAAESKMGTVRGLWPGLEQVDPLVLLLALGGLGAVLVSAVPTGVAVVCLAAVSLVTAVRMLGIQVRSPAGSEGVARKEMAAAVKALVDRTWVSRTGDAIFENVPLADEVRTTVARLEHTLDRARVRAEELGRLEVELVELNRSLGRTETDPELAALRRRRARLDAELERVEQLRTRFRERLLASESDLERLRLLARRRAVHRRIQQLGEDSRSDALVRSRAEAEVDLPGFDRSVGSLAREVADVERQLAASVEVATIGDR